jgi:Transposase
MSTGLHRRRSGARGELRRAHIPGARRLQRDGRDYGRQLVGALSAAGLEVLHVPAWRTHRERYRQGPRKTDPGDALAIADVVRRKHGELSPALEPELVRALAMLELQRRRFVRDRTQAIQRLRSDWTRQDPVAEAGALRCNSQHELRRLKRIRFGDSLTDQIAARCIRELARDIEDLTSASPPSTERSPCCSTSTTTRSPTCRAPAPTSPQGSITTDGTLINAPDARSTGAITGGTGRFRNARGVAVLDLGPPEGPHRASFRLIPQP